MRITENKKESTVTFIVEEGLSLPNVSEIHQMISKGVQGFDNVVFEADEVTEIDLSFIQLVYSLKKTKTVTWNGTLNDDQTSILKIAGIKGF